MTHKNIDAWKESINLVLEIYSLTKEFPKEELYCLVNQIRRCAISIPSNIAEGCARQTPKETIQFLHITLGSLAELETQLIIVDELKYANNAQLLISKLAHIRKLVVGLVKFQKSKA